jgi:hypothetical protein
VPDPAAFEPDSGVADNAGDVQWPEQPKMAAPAPSPRYTASSGRRSVGRQRREATSHVDQSARRTERPRARAGSEAHRADRASKAKSVAALYSPVQQTPH